MTIDTLKSTISKRGGLARSNRFNVMFTPPTMSLGSRNSNTLVGSLASGDTGGAADSRDIALLCESVSIPSRAISTLDYVSDRQSNKFPYTHIDEDVQMSFILTNDYYVKRVFDSWLSSIIDVNDYAIGYKNDYSTDVTIQHLDLEGKVIHSIKLQKAYPLSINAIELNNASENEMSKVTVSFAYDKYVMED